MKSSLYTFQEFEKATNKVEFILASINNHMGSEIYKTALLADLYDKQMNTTINQFIQTVYNAKGIKVENAAASNAKIASNFFHRLNTQRCMYSLGNGVSFIEGKETGDDATKEKLGKHFDHDIQDAAYKSLIHGVVFCFWNVDRLYNFPVTEFVPYWDEFDGALMAGARFWRLSPDYPLTVVVYEQDGYTKYQAETNSDSSLREVAPKRAYIEHVKKVPADANEEVVGVENYSSLPIVPMWGSKNKQSTLIGLQGAIDSYDIIRSGFANDLTDCAQIYWLVENAGGMDETDLAEFLDRLVFNHIANIDGSAGSKATPYTQEIPYEARNAYLEQIRNEIYESFGALDVHTVAAGATNDHIDAAYQPMDEEAQDFEFQVAECIRQILALIGIDDSPVFKRNRISNQREQVEMVLMEAQYLDTQTILQKLPNISPDEVQAIIERTESEDMERITSERFTVEEDGDQIEETVEPSQNS